MDKIVNWGKGKAFSNEDICKLCEGEVHIVTYPQLAFMNNIRQLLGKHKAAIILYMTRQRFGHWVAIFEVPGHPDTIEFFDSYSMKPDDELDMIPDHFRVVSGQSIPHLTRLLNTSKYKNILYNDIRLQKRKDDTATCGRWAGIRVSMKEIPLEKFQKLFTGQTFDPDWYVSALTLFI
jgi:hypothetical protein